MEMKVNNPFHFLKISIINLIKPGSYLLIASNLQGNVSKNVFLGQQFNFKSLVNSDFTRFFYFLATILVAINLAKPIYIINDKSIHCIKR